jgi:hypothetical protein
MKAASLHELKKEVSTLKTGELQSVCMRLAKYKKENKELLTYLLFESPDEAAYVEGVKTDINEQFAAIPNPNLYYVKKSLRKILRMVNRQIRYSESKQTELELRIHFCQRLKESGIPLDKSPVLQNLYQQQLKKISITASRLPEDLQFDYQRSIESLH